VCNNETGYEDLYKDLEENGSKKKNKLARTRQKKLKDLNKTVLVKDEQSKVRSKDKGAKGRW